MNKLKFLFVLLIGLSSCKTMVKEMKKINRLRRIVKESCECNYVTVDKNYNGGNMLLDVVITKSWSEDHAVTAENVYLDLQDSMSTICNYGKVTIAFEEDDFQEQFIYYRCGQAPEIDTIFYNQFDDEDWDEFMDDSI